MKKYKEYYNMEKNDYERRHGEIIEPVKGKDGNIYLSDSHRSKYYKAIWTIQNRVNLIWQDAMYARYDHLSPVDVLKYYEIACERNPETQSPDGIRPDMIIETMDELINNCEKVTI